MYASEKNNMRILYGLTPSVPLQEIRIGSESDTKAKNDVHKPISNLDWIQRRYFNKNCATHFAWP